MVSRKVAGLVLAGVVLAGCSEDKIPPVEIDVFTGEVAVANIKQSPPYTYHDTDIVIFTVEGIIYKLDHVSGESGLCSSGGRVLSFGTNMLTLTPTTIDYGNCDTLKIPQGEFKAVFRRDSLYLGPDTEVFVGSHIDTMIYHFRLTK